MSGDIRDLPREDWELGRILWEFHRLSLEVAKSDAIIVLGSNDKRVAERGAELWLRGIAPIIVATGGHGNFTRHWPETEATTFAAILSSLRIPHSVTLIEDASMNTGENLRFSLDLLKARGMSAKSLTLVHKPFMERRTLATADVVCPDVLCTVTSPTVDYDSYPNSALPADHLLTAMVGDLDRVVQYPSRGLQSQQAIPVAVIEAGEELKRRGYDSHQL